MLRSQWSNSWILWQRSWWTDLCSVCHCREMQGEWNSAYRWTGMIFLRFFLYWVQILTWETCHTGKHHGPTSVSLLINSAHTFYYGLPNVPVKFPEPPWSCETRQISCISISMKIFELMKQPIPMHVTDCKYLNCNWTRYLGSSREMKSCSWQWGFEISVLR